MGRGDSSHTRLPCLDAHARRGFKRIGSSFSLDLGRIPGGRSGFTSRHYRHRSCLALAPTSLGALLVNSALSKFAKLAAMNAGSTRTDAPLRYRFMLGGKLVRPS